MAMESIQNPGRKKSLNEKETVDFLEQNGIQKLETQIEGDPLWYVMEEVTRGNKGPLAAKLKNGEMIPSVVRLDRPQMINFNAPRGSEDVPGRVIFNLKSAEGRVDYYAIDAETKEPVLVRSSAENRVYHVRKETLFTHAEHLFPKGKTSI